ncbi:hypothetical protein [Natronosalvus caseinilyticus]|uniref:hypothetical protein n=1 Tax=Natronosalvus caseinilyticus TaxID=2953747 RepID=UPI0028A82278|nr:hypothetical protein [Natronosalvus caseinilyticus]
MLRDPLRRCIGITVLLVDLVGVLVLGGAGWSVDAAVADGSSGAEEIVPFEGANFNLGAEYRTPRSTASQDNVAGRSTVAGGSVDATGLANALVAPADRSGDVQIGGLLYVHAISAIGAAVVAGRALVGWRLELRGLALVPRGGRRVGRWSDPDRRQALRADGVSRRGA